MIISSNKTFSFAHLRLIAGGKNFVVSNGKQKLCCCILEYNALGPNWIFNKTSDIAII